MKPVLFIIERPTPQRAPVLNELHNRGVAIHVVYVHGDAAEQGWGNVMLDHPHEFVGSSGETRASAIASRIRQGSYSALVSMGYRGSLRASALTAARLTRLPIAMRFDTNQLQIEGSDSYRRFARRTLMKTLIPRSASAWAIGSQNERFWREEVGLRTIVSIPYEVPVLPGDVDAYFFSRVRHSDPKRLRFLYVGRLTSIKKVDDAIEAFMNTHHPGWSLQIVGSGPDEPRLRRQAANDTRINFIGSQTYSELGAHFEQSDVLVLPSAGEPWGLVVNEALGYALRVIASDQVGAAYDLVTPKNGEVYPVGDIGAMASALDRCQVHLKQVSRPPATNTADLMQADLERLTRTRL